MRAFKMPMDDQRATTTVVDVVWSASHQGYWIPRIQIQPVQIGGSRIEFLTGHNARVIVQNKISKGAVIVVRKSGDVIPTLERVVSEGSEPILPEGVWDGDAASAAHYKVKTGSTTLEIQSKKLEHFASTLGIPHLGPGLVAKLVSDGKDTPRLLLTCSKEEMEKSLGKGMAAKIFPQIQERLTAATELDLMIASSLMPRGVGSTKLKALFEVESDPRHWNEVLVCEGWSEGALKEFQKSFPQYEEWRRTQLSMIPYPKLFTPPPKPQQTGVLYRICMTGFRDKELQAQLEAKGHEFVQAISSKVSLLLVKDPSETSEKLKKARELGIRILSREQAKLELL
jgi:DNA ligase (NAD+)